MKGSFVRSDRRMVMKIAWGVTLIIFGLGWLFFWVLFFGLGFYFTPEVEIPVFFVAVFVGIGLVPTIVGAALVIIGILAGRKNQEIAKNVFTEGIPTRARVTFVDKNYAFQVNEKPIYSVIEFEFTDQNGMQHTARKTNADSDLVIRNQIMVGSEVDIKFMAENPDDNILILHDPRVGQA
jgi:hypothetical protein